MKNKLNRKQMKFLSHIGIKASSIKDMDEADLEEKVSVYLQMYGFDENYEPTEEGKICESILDMLQ